MALVSLLEYKRDTILPKMGHSKSGGSVDIRCGTVK